MNGTKRLIPRLEHASVSFGDASRGARSGTPSWLGAVTVAVAGAGACVASIPADASADPGSVVLRNGGRVGGEIVAVVPNDRVVVRLEDGSTMSFPWSEVQFVFDGDRVFDGAGNMTAIPAPPTPPAPPAPPATPPDPATLPVPAPPSARLVQPAPLPFSPAAARYSGAYPYGPQGPFDPALMAQYLNLPRRGGAVALATFGGIFIAEGILTISIGATDDCYGFFGGYYGGYGYSGGSDGSCSFRKWMIGSGTVNAGLGALMTGFAARRLHRRARAIRDLRRQGMLVAESDDGLEVTFDLDASSNRLVPQLRLRF